jgi:hypothetical protein
MRQQLGSAVDEFEPMQGLTLSCNQPFQLPWNKSFCKVSHGASVDALSSSSVVGSSPGHHQMHQSTNGCPPDETGE